MAYSFDTTLGVALAIGIHMGSVRVCRQWAVALPSKPNSLWKLIADCGNYGKRLYARQLSLLNLCPAENSCCAWLIG